MFAGAVFVPIIRFWYHWRYVWPGWNEKGSLYFLYFFKGRRTAICSLKDIFTICLNIQCLRGKILQFSILSLRCFILSVRHSAWKALPGDPIFDCLSAVEAIYTCSPFVSFLRYWHRCRYGEPSYHTKISKSCHGLYRIFFCPLSLKEILWRPEFIFFLLSYLLLYLKYRHSHYLIMFHISVLLCFIFIQILGAVRLSRVEWSAFS